MDYQESFESIAKAELEVARRLAQNKDYWTAVYHSQQAAEKMTKAVLFKHRVIEMKEHIISGLFASRVLRQRRSKELKPSVSLLAAVGGTYQQIAPSGA